MVEGLGPLDDVVRQRRVTGTSASTPSPAALSDPHGGFGARRSIAETDVLALLDQVAVTSVVDAAIVLAKFVPSWPSRVLDTPALTRWIGADRCYAAWQTPAISRRAEGACAS